jgi:hypothetical protein
MTLDVKKSNSSNETPNVMTAGVEKYGLRNIFAIIDSLTIFCGGLGRAEGPGGGGGGGASDTPPPRPRTNVWQKQQQSRSNDEN